MKPKFYSRRHLGLIVLASAAAGMSPAAFGQTSTGWKGTTSNDMQTGANWDNGFGNNNDLFFGNAWVAAGGTGATTINNNSAYSGYRLTFEANASTPTFTIQGSTITLFDFGGAVPKIENYSSVNQNVNTAITFGSGDHGEINAVNGTLTMGGAITATSVNGLRFYGSGQTINLNGTVTATGKYVGTSSTGGNTINVNGAVTALNFSIINGSILNLSSTGTLNTDVRLGVDYTGSTNVNNTLGATFNLTNATGGQTFANVINSGGGTNVTGATNTSGALVVNSQNTSNTNTLSGHLALDSNLTISQATGGTLAITQGRSTASGTTAGTDIKAQTLTFNTVGTGAINVGPASATGFGTIYDSVSGSSGTGIIKTGTGSLSFNDANSYRGKTQINAGTLFVGANNALGSSNGTVGTTGNTVLLGDTTGGSAANLLTTGAFTIANVISLQSGNSGVMTLGGNTAAAAIYSGAVSLGTIGSAAAAKDGTFVAFSSGSADFQGVIGEGTSNTTNANVTIGDSTHSGTVKFSNAANTYTGSTTIGNGATLEIAALAAGGSNSSIGNSSGTAAGNLTLDNGTLRYTGTTAQGTSRFFTIGAGGATFDASSSNNSALTFTGAGAGSMVASGSGNRTLTLTGTSTGANAMSNIIVNPGTGTTAVTKSGAGTWALSGVNTFTGNILISSGTLAAGTGITGGTAASIGSNLGDLGTGTGARSITVNNGGILSLTGGNTLGTGGSTGTLNNFTLNVNQGGVFQTGSPTTLGGFWNKMGAINLDGGTIHVGTGANNSSFQGLALIGTVTVGGTSTTASTIDNFAGSLAGSNGVHLGQNGASTITFNVADVTSSAASDLNVSVSLLNSSSTQSASGLTKTGAGTLSLSGANTYTGTTTISGGTLKNGSATTFSGSNTALSMSSTGTFDLGGFNASISNISAMASTNTITNSGGANAVLSVTGEGSVSLAGLFTDGSTNNLAITMANTNATTQFTNSGNTFSGGLNLLNNATGTRLYINTAISFAGTPGALTSSNFGTGTITIGTTGTDKAGIRFDTAASGTLANAIVFNTALGTDLAGISSTTTSGVTLAGSITANSNAAFNTNATNAKLTVSGAISGSGGVVVTQSTGTGGIVTLSGANTYTGATTVTAGTLQIASTGSLANTAIAVSNASSTFAVNTTSGGSVNIGNSVTSAAGATLNLGAGTIFSMVDTVVGTTNLQQGATFASTALTLGGATLNLELNSTAADLLAVTKTAAISGTNTINLTTLGSSLTAGTYNLLTATSGLTGTFQFASGLSNQVVTLSGTSYLLTLNNSTSAESVTVAASSGITWTGQTLGNGANDSGWNTTTSSNWASGTTPVGFNNGNDVIFQDTNTVTGSNVTNGIVTIQAAGVSPTSVTFNNSAVNYTVSNASGNVGIAGSGGITKSGSGTVTLSSLNTYTGTTTINAGTVAISNNNNIGANAAAVTLNGGTLQDNLVATGQTNTHVITVGASGGTIQITSTSGTPTYILGAAGNLTGSGNLTVSGNGTLTQAGSAGASVFVMGNANTGYSGNLTVTNGGVIEYANATGIPVTSTFTVNNLGMLDATNGITIAQNVSVNNGGTLGFQNSTGTFSGAITLTGSTTVRLQNWHNATVQSGAISGAIGGTGSLTVNSGSSTGGTLTLSGVNTFSGDITSTGSSNITINGAGQLGSGSYAGNITMTGGTFTYGSSAAQTLSGIISGTGALTKSGTTSTLTLSGANSYSGATNLNAGTLQAVANVGNTTAGVSSALSANSAITMTTGTTLQLRADADTTFATNGISLITNPGGAGFVSDNTSFTFDVNAATAASNKTLTLGGTIGMSLPGGNVGFDTATINVTGASGYTLALGTVNGGRSGSGFGTVFNVDSGLNLTVGAYNSDSGANPGALSFSGAGNATMTGAIQRGSARNLFVTFNQTGTVTLNSAGINNGGGAFQPAALNAGTTVFNNVNALQGVQINLGNQTASSTAAANFLLGGSTGLNGGLSFGSTVRPFETTSGLLTIGGQNTSGTNTYTAGMQLGNGTNLGKSVNLVAAPGGTVSFTSTILKNGTDTTAGVTINDAYTVNGATVTPSGTVQLANAGNTFAGGLSIKGGTLLQTAGAGTLGVGTVTLGDGSTARSAMLTGNVGATTTNTNAITIASGGSGTYTISDISNSDLIFSGAVALDNAATFKTTAGGQLAFTNTITGSSLITIDGAGTTTKNVLLSGNNSASFTGNVLVQNGLANTGLKLGASNALSTANTVTIDATSGIDLGGFNLSIAGLNDVVTGAGGSKITGTGNVTFGGSGTYSFSGVINSTGAKNLTKSGSGTQTLAGTNTYTGTTSVNAGKLLVGGSIGSSAVSVSNAGTILASGTTGTIGSSVTVNDGAILAAGDVNSIGTATVTNGTTFNDGSIFSWDLSASGSDTLNPGSYDKVVAGSVGGDGAGAAAAIFRIVLAGGGNFNDSFWQSSHSWTNIFTGATDLAAIFGSNFEYRNVNQGGISDPTVGSFTFQGSALNYNFTAVPEPTTALAGLLIGAGLLRRRRKN